MNLGPAELVIIFAMLLGFVIPVWAIVDAASRPPSAFAAIGSSKTTQIVVLVVTALLCSFVGTMLSLIYLVGPRRQLKALTPS